jgi:tetratricopeptide (TPR) repeat protein
MKSVQIFFHMLRKLSVLMGCAVLTLMISTRVSAQSKYIKLCKQGVAYEEKGSLDTALLTYNEAISLKPSDACAYTCKASTHYLKGNYDDAITEVSQAITLKPNSPYSYIIRGSCYLEKKIYDKAISDYTSAISKLNANNYFTLAAYTKRGMSYYYNKQYEPSIADFTKCIELSTKQKISGSSVYYDWRARCYVETGKYADAAKDFEYYLITEPTDLTATFYQGYSYYKNGESDKAKTVALKLIDLDPSKEISFKGDNLLDIYDLDKRRKIVKGLLDDANQSLKEYKETSSKALGKIKLDDAFQSLDSAWFYCSGIKDEDLVIQDTMLNKLDRVYSIMKNKPEIPELARKYIVQAGKSTEEKIYSDALKLYGKAIAIAPYYPMSYYNRALLKGTMGSYADAITDMKKYIQCAPDASDVRAAKDKIYEWENKTGKTNAAPNSSENMLLAKIISENYNPGKYFVALAIGGSVGPQMFKNNSLSDFWHLGYDTTKKYNETSHVLLSADAEIVIKPIKYIGVGMFYKTIGGIGSSGTTSETHPQLAMPCSQIGGLARLYLENGDGRNKMDLFFQYGFAKSKLNGYYNVWQSNSLMGPFGMSLDGSGPYRSIGFGFGGKLGKVGYMVMSLDYISAVFDNIQYNIGVCEADPSRVGETGTLKPTTYSNNSGIGDNVTARYNGLLLKWVFGICF